MAGFRSENPLYSKPPQASNPITTQYNLYNNAVKQQAEDYSNLAGRYMNVANRAAATPQMKFSAYKPAQQTYAPSADYTGAVSNLKGLANTGGYSEGDISNIRERGISPIRAIYANAERELNRQKNLSGGYSPNAGAVRAKMAREMSSSIGDRVTDINARLAEAIVGNKMRAAPMLADATWREQAARGDINAANVGARNRASEFNLEMPLRYAAQNQGTRDDELRALGGMQSLYGTTPALSALFGSQAMGSAGLQNQITQQNRQSGLDTVSRMVRRR